MTHSDTPDDSLRSRQKSRRRRDILESARSLFESEGYYATTMARIAEVAEVSTPTVFNYFGSKDGVVTELVLSGRDSMTEKIQQWQPADGISLGEMLGEFMCLYLKLSMEIAGKSVWRFAEATNIRRHDDALVKFYDQIEDEHVQEITRRILSFGPDDTSLPTGRGELLARVIYNHWNALFFGFIRTDERSIDQQCDLIRGDVQNLVESMGL